MQHDKQRADFARVKTTGQAKAGRFVILSTLEDPALEYLRTGFITTKRCGKAHDRNLLRRRFRALVQAHAAANFRKSAAISSPSRAPGAAQATFAELEADWLRQARRLGLLPTTRANAVISAHPQRRHPRDDPFLSADPQSDAEIRRRSRRRAAASRRPARTISCKPWKSTVPFAAHGWEFAGFSAVIHGGAAVMTPSRRPDAVETPTSPPSPHGPPCS